MASVSLLCDTTLDLFFKLQVIKKVKTEKNELTCKLIWTQPLLPFRLYSETSNLSSGATFIVNAQT